MKELLAVLMLVAIGCAAEAPTDPLAVFWRDCQAANTTSWTYERTFRGETTPTQAAAVWMQRVKPDVHPGEVLSVRKEHTIIALHRQKSTSLDGLVIAEEAHDSHQGWTVDTAIICDKRRNQ